MRINKSLPGSTDPAFPVNPGATTGWEAGMTLRDWFAGQVAANVANKQGYAMHAGNVAAMAYEIADAMLEMRAK